MTTLLDLSDHLRAHLSSLRGYENVVAVGVGDKQSGGELVGRESIQVYVTDKVPASALAADQLLPTGVGDLIVDVIPVGRIRRRTRYEAHPGHPIIAGSFTSPARHRVLEGGMGISAGYGPGTIGCFLEEVGDPTGRVYALTNDHVVTKENDPQSVVGRVVGHTRRGHFCVGLCARAVGEIAAHTLDGWTEPLGASQDIALVQLDEGVAYSPSIFRIGPIYDHRDLADTEVDDMLNAKMQVLKHGRATRTTGGYLVGYDLHAVVDGDIQLVADHPHSVAIEPNPVWDGGGGMSHFLDDGDSGAVCIDLDGRVLALMNSSQPVRFGGRSFGTIWSVVMAWVNGPSLTDVPELELAVHDGVRDLIRVAGGGDAVARDVLLEVGFQRLADIGVGREVWRLWGSHSEEILHLVNSNARVATVWHRSGLPILIHHLIRLAGDETRRLPARIDGQPIERCLGRFVDELARHASSELRADLLSIGPIPDLAGCTYDEVVHRLEVA